MYNVVIQTGVSNENFSDLQRHLSTFIPSFFGHLQLGLIGQ